MVFEADEEVDERTMKLLLLRGGKPKLDARQPRSRVAQLGTENLRWLELSLVPQVLCASALCPNNFDCIVMYC